MKELLDQQKVKKFDGSKPVTTMVNDKFVYAG